MHWQAIAGILLLLCIQPAITGWRWNLLLRAQKIVVLWPGGRARDDRICFNVLIPGAVGGDLIKGLHSRAARGRRSAAATSILMDRVIGLFGLWLLAALMMAFKVR